MKRISILVKTLVLTLLLQAGSGLFTNLSGQIQDNLPRSTPELEGVASSGIIDFINAIDTGRQEIHSFMFLRHGKVIAEGWWSPYAPSYKHLLFSASKTFTATAVGLAVSEGRLKITDKVTSFFPYSLPDTIGNFMKELTVRDLLTMSVGQEAEPRAMGNTGDWITMFLKSEPEVKPGTVFKYNNMATFMLAAIVQQVTGQTVFDYLMPRIFKPLGIRGIDWDLNPQGINLGMIGLRLRTEDLAKFGKLLIQQGVWNNKQLIPKEWVQEATSLKIKTPLPPNIQDKEVSDWSQGYCYQMWRGKSNTVRLDGMGGQFVVLIPDKDAIVVLTANASNTQTELNLVHKYLIPAIKSDKALPENPALYMELENRQTALSLKPVSATGLSTSEIELKISGKEFAISKNSNNIQSVYFTFNANECSFALRMDDNISIIKFGLESWKMSNSLLSSLITPPRTTSKSVDANYKILEPLIKVGASYTWIDKYTLELTARFIEESLGSETIVCKFSEINGAISLIIEKKGGRSMMGMPGPAAIPLRGNLITIN